MKQSRTRTVLRWTAIVGIALLLHVLLAPWTVRTTHALREAAKDWQARRDSARHLAKLRKMPDVPLDRFLACATAFRDHLDQRGIKLTVMPWPENQTMMAKDGEPQLQADALGSCLFQAARELRARHIKVMEIFPEVHEQFCLHPANATTHHPDNHLSAATQEMIAEVIYKNIDRHILVKNGRGILFTGECYAYLIGTILQKHEELSETSFFWKNSRSDLVPYEVAMLPDSELKGVRQLIWMVPGRWLLSSNSEGFFPPFEAFLAAQPKVTAGTHAVLATVTEASPVPATLGKDSPYPAALRQLRWRGANGEDFLGLVPVMTKHEVDGQVQLWGQGSRLLLTVCPWDEAQNSRPDLRHEQILDTAVDFTLPRYYILHWMNVP